MYICRIDEHFQSEVNLSPMEKMKINFYFHVIDKICVELKERFPPKINDFAFLDVRHFNAIDAEARIFRLASIANGICLINLLIQMLQSKTYTNSFHLHVLIYTFCTKYC